MSSSSSESSCNSSSMSSASMMSEASSSTSTTEVSSNSCLSAKSGDSFGNNMDSFNDDSWSWDELLGWWEEVNSSQSTDCLSDKNKFESGFSDEMSKDHTDFMEPFSSSSDNSVVSSKSYCEVNSQFESSVQSIDCSFKMMDGSSE